MVGRFEAGRVSGLPKMGESFATERHALHYLPQNGIHRWQRSQATRAATSPPNASASGLTVEG